MSCWNDRAIQWRPYAYMTDTIFNPHRWYGMADRLTAQARSRNMARVRDRNTGPELTVRRLLHRMGYRFRLHRKDLPGRPDIVLPRYRSVIFVHGCFWHGHSGCRAAARPTSNAEFWNRKLDSNIQRDQAVRQELTGQKWNVLVVWECELREIQALEERLRAFLQPDNDNCKGEAASGDQ